MLTSRSLLPAIAVACVCSVADAQLRFQRVADFGDPNARSRRFTGGREVEFTEDGEKLIAAFYGSTAQLFDLKGNVPIGKPIRTAGDGEVGFVNNEVAYTAIRCDFGIRNRASKSARLSMAGWMMASSRSS